MMDCNGDRGILLKYNPLLDDIKAVLRVHLDAAIDIMSEGTALRIAASRCRLKVGVGASNR